MNSIFLSKVSPDRRRWDVVHDLDDRDRLHKKMCCFYPAIPGGPTNMRERYGILYRVEGNSILLQSRMEPLKGKVKEEGPAGYSVIATKDVTAIYETIQAGRSYRYRLDANTSMRAPVEQDPIGWIPEEAPLAVETRRQTKRVGCGTNEERAKWFQLAAKRSGFEIQNFAMESLPIIKVKGIPCLEITRFEGGLKVVDREIFLSALSAGIGQGKSYGLGLLSLRAI